MWKCQNKHAWCKKLKSICMTTAHLNNMVKQLPRTFPFRSRSSKYCENGPLFISCLYLSIASWSFRKDLRMLVVSWLEHSAQCLPSLPGFWSVTWPWATMLCIPLHTETLETSLSQFWNENVVATYFLNLTQHQSPHWGVEEKVGISSLVTRIGIIQSQTPMVLYGLQPHDQPISTVLLIRSSYPLKGSLNVSYYAWL